MSNTAIEFDGLSKSFGSVKVLDELSLKVPIGAVYGFLGNNGAGKSTTIRLILGLLKAQSGEIRIFDQAITGDDYLYRKDIGALVDSPCLYPHLSAVEFLRIGQSIKQLKKSEIERVIELVGLTKFKNRKIETYSLGMKQRLAIGHALLGEPRLLILDEPTNGLDPIGMREIRSLIQSLPKRMDTTVFVSSHLLDEIEKIASHVGVLNKGKLIVQSTLKELIESKQFYLDMCVEHPEQAVLVLARAGYSVKLQDNNRIHISVATYEQCPEIHHHLQSQQIRLYESTFMKPSLENTFLDLMDIDKDL